MINVKIFVDQLSESESIMPGSPMAPMFVKMETHKTIKDELRKDTNKLWESMRIKKDLYKKTFINTFSARLQ